MHRRHASSGTSVPCVGASMPVLTVFVPGHGGEVQEMQLEIRGQMRVQVPMQKWSSPIKLGVWEIWLQAYPKVEDAQYLQNVSLGILCQDL